MAEESGWKTMAMDVDLARNAVKAGCDRRHYVNALLRLHEAVIRELTKMVLPEDAADIHIVEGEE